MLNVALLLFPTGQAASLWGTVVSFSSRWDHPCGEYQHSEPRLTLSCPCLNTEIVLCHIVVCRCVFLSGALHNAAAWKLPQDWKISAEKGDDQFLREHPPSSFPFFSSSSPNPLPHTAPWPLHLLLLLTSTSHNYFAKELQKKNTQSNFSCPVMKSSLKQDWNKQSFSCEAPFQIHFIISLCFNHLYQLIIPWWKRYSSPSSVVFCSSEWEAWWGRQENVAQTKVE